MSELDQNRKGSTRAMLSALHPRADMARTRWHVCQVPGRETHASQQTASLSLRSSGSLLYGRFFGPRPNHQLKDTMKIFSAVAALVFSLHGLTSFAWGQDG